MEKNSFSCFVSHLGTLDYVDTRGFVSIPASHADLSTQHMKQRVNKFELKDMLPAHQALLTIYLDERPQAGATRPQPFSRSSFWLTLEIGNLLVVVKKEGAKEGGIFICSAEDKYLGLAAI